MKIQLKKILTSLLLLTAMVAYAEQEPVEYVTCSWNSADKTVVHTSQTCSQYAQLSGGSSQKLESGWYVVRGTVSYSGALKVKGSVHLIIYHRSQLSCKGIEVAVADNAELHIHTQSSGEGIVESYNDNENEAGIGSFARGDDLNAGTVVIHGGTVRARGGEDAAGIGGGYSNSGGNVIIYDGDITATCTDDGAGIGGGKNRGINIGTSVTIYGGKVKAESNYGAGIGSGNSGSQGGHIVIWGGEVTAIGHNYSSGLGSGWKGDATQIDIHGGTVTATGGDDAPGIGGGDNGYFDYINISGGNVTAYGGKNAAGIGLGYQVKATQSMHNEVNISGGTVRAYGGEDGAGIGCGWIGIINRIVISGGDVRAAGRDDAAGIGGGNRGYAKEIVISGGTVVAIAGSTCNARESHGGSAIGPGDYSGYGSDDPKDNFLPVIGDHLKVTAGDSEDSPDGTSSASNRAAACVWRNFARVEPCDHVGANFDMTSFEHKINCSNCNSQTFGYMAHTMVDEQCTVCGYSTIYAAFDSENSTLYFGRGDMPAISNGESWKGSAIAHSPADAAPLWNNSRVQTCCRVVIDKSFADVQPKCLHAWFKGFDQLAVIEGLAYLNTEAATDMSQLFMGCSTLTSLDLTAFNPSAVTNMSEMFADCADLCVIYVDDRWDASHVAASTDMFRGCSYLMGGNGTLYDAYHTDKEYARIDCDDTPGYLTTWPTLTLTDNSDNSEAISDAADSGDSYKVTLDGRRLNADGSWNTLCLPFSLTLADSPLENAVARTLDSSTLSDGTLTLNFAEPVTELKAGVPYIIKWPSGTDVPVNYQDISGTNNAGALFDGILDSRWEVASTKPSTAVCTFSLSQPVFVTDYTLTTVSIYNGTTPTGWTLKAKLQEGDEWVTLSTVDDETALNDSWTAFTFPVSADRQAFYQHFMLEVTGLVADDYDNYHCELAECRIGGRLADINGLTVRDVTVTAAEPCDVTTDAVIFRGCYDPMPFPNQDRTILYMGSDNKLYYPNGQATVTINPFRAYFVVKDSAAEVHSIELNIDEESPTTIEDIALPTRPVTTVTYNLTGQRVDATYKGLIIKNGRKFVVK